MLTKTDDNSNTLFSDRYQQTYHSTFGALTESSHVFLHGSGVHDRLSAKRPTSVLEIGFGLGLNCLVCADSATANLTHLSYTGVEHSPISAATLNKLDYGRWLGEPGLAMDLGRLLADLPPVGPTSAQRMLGTHCKLCLHTHDATSPALQDKLRENGPYDAVFLDAFSPDVNPECWTAGFFSQLRSLLAPDGRLATYCVKGSVRRNLAKADFKVYKYPGPMGKREVLWAGIASTTGSLEPKNAQD